MSVSTVWLIVFVESVDEQQRSELETVYRDEEREVQVEPVFVQTGDEREGVFTDASLAPTQSPARDA
ncbi:hypothetical protein KFU94_07535 [Chloroflexi bacterium TSY]|nr:hypothetical protein [Chloroflexi bacterium TSY]